MRLKEDKKMSGKTQNLPAKVFKGGAKVRQFLTNHNLGKEKHTLSQSKEDKKMSGKTQNLLAKVSMGGAKARRFLSNHNLGKEKHTLSHSPSSWECWKALCECTTNNASHPSTMTFRAKVWPSVKLLRQSQSDKMYYEKFRMAVTKFT